MPADNTRLEVGTLGGWLWEATCKIRGPVDAPKYKDYILPLIKCLPRGCQERKSTIRYDS